MLAETMITLITEMNKNSAFIYLTIFLGLDGS